MNHQCCCAERSSTGGGTEGKPTGPGLLGRPFHLQHTRVPYGWYQPRDPGGVEPDVPAARARLAVDSACHRGLACARLAVQREESTTDHRTVFVAKVRIVPFPQGALIVLAGLITMSDEYANKSPALEQCSGSLRTIKLAKLLKHRTHCSIVSTSLGGSACLRPCSDERSNRVGSGAPE